MQINSIQNLSFKAVQLKKDNSPASQSAQLKEVMKKQGLNSMPVKICAPAGFILGGIAGAIKHKQPTKALFEALCMCGLGAIIGKAINFINNKTQDGLNK